jgi:hypothetical protein
MSVTHGDVWPDIGCENAIALDRSSRTSFLSIARFDGGWLRFVVTGVLDREQDTTIGFIGKLSQ